MKKEDAQLSKEGNQDGEWTEETINDSMNELKQAYESIRIPDGLRQNVMSAIEEGKKEADENQEQNRRTRGNPMKKFIIRTGQTAAAALIAITILANSGAGVAYAMERIPVIGAITKVVTFRTYEKKEGRAEADIKVPRVEAEDGSSMGNAAKQLNRSVEEYTDRLIAQFETDVKEENGQIHKAVYSDYEVLIDNDDLFTLRINTDEIMASGEQSVKIYNIDKKTDRILTLKDMFPAETDYVALISDTVKARMQEDMNAGEGKIYFLNDGMDSDFQSVKPEQNFYINTAGHMVIVFDEYEVAPGFMGIVEIELPEDIFLYKSHK